MTMEIKMEFPVKEFPSMDISKFIQDPDERVWNGPFTFVQAADTQFGMIDKYYLKNAEPTWDKEVKLARESVERINKMNPKPRFYIICGDMLDAFPLKADRDLRARQYADFVPIFRDLDPEVKLICVCGNHDIGDIPTEETLAVYRNQFGPDVFSFWTGGVKFVVLNSQYFEEPEAIPEETAKQLSFLETIHDPSAKHIVVFQHIPYFLKDPYEPRTFWKSNLRQDVRIRILDKLRENGVKYVFCGHYHENAGGHYKDLELVVTSALGAPTGEDPSGFRIVNVDEEKISHEYIPFRETSSVDLI